MEVNQRVRVSVRNLVEFILRFGDIDSRRGGLGEKEAMQEGSRIHRKLQARRRPSLLRLREGQTEFSGKKQRMFRNRRRKRFYGLTRSRECTGIWG